jgi:hypothetical protein
MPTPCGSRCRSPSRRARARGWAAPFPAAWRARPAEN